MSPGLSPLPSYTKTLLPRVRVSDSGFRAQGLGFKVTITITNTLTMAITSTTAIAAIDELRNKDVGAYDTKSRTNRDNGQLT